MENNGIFKGINMEKKTPIVIDVFSGMKPSNNWLKMHHKPMRRKPLKKTNGNLFVFGMTGRGHSFARLFHDVVTLPLHGDEYNSLK